MIVNLGNVHVRAHVRECPCPCVRECACVFTVCECDGFVCGISGVFIYDVMHSYVTRQDEKFKLPPRDVLDPYSMKLHGITPDDSAPRVHHPIAGMSVCVCACVRCDVTHECVTYLYAS